LADIADTVTNNMLNDEYYVINVILTLISILTSAKKARICKEMFRQRINDHSVDMNM